MRYVKGIFPVTIQHNLWNGLQQFGKDSEGIIDKMQYLVTTQTQHK